MNCQWCDKPFREKAGKKYCDSTCKGMAHTVARLYTEYQIERGLLSWAPIKNWYEGPYTAQQTPDLTKQAAEWL